MRRRGLLGAVACAWLVLSCGERSGQESAPPPDALPLIDRVGFNAIPPSDVAAISEVLPVGWYKDFTSIGRRVEVDGRTIDYVPILPYQSQADTPEFLAQFGGWVDAGLVPTPGSMTKEDYLDFLSLDRMRGRIETRREDFPDGMLFQFGNEPGFMSSRSPDPREPAEIVADARIVREVLDGFGRGYRLALGGMSTPRYDFMHSGYRGRYGFEFWEEILELAGPDLFDAFVIHPYPSSLTEPTVEDLRSQILEARRLLARFGHREKDLLVGETSPLPMPPMEQDTVVRYVRGAVELYLTARDPEIGNPRDGNRLVQRFCWFFLDARPMPERNGLDLRLVSLLGPDGDLSPVGVAFRDTVKRIIDEAD